jgi:diguanylate cyclase (GGDEF)-like protein
MSRQLAKTESGLRAANEALATKLKEIEELHRRLQEQSIRDPVTDLFNRRFLDEMIDHELACAKRDGYPLVVAMIDLDHFKQVNDTFGHKAGDAVLRALGDLLRAQVREGDVACRYGGEEFALLLPRMPLADASRRAEDWRAALEALVICHGALDIRVTMSAGLAAYPAHGASAGELIDAADKALYRAKANGRNRVETAPSR